MNAGRKGKMFIVRNAESAGVLVAVLNKAG
jgi:hypothetical protein